MPTARPVSGAAERWAERAADVIPIAEPPPYWYTGVLEGTFIHGPCPEKDNPEGTCDCRECMEASIRREAERSGRSMAEVAEEMGYDELPEGI